MIVYFFYENLFYLYLNYLRGWRVSFLKKKHIIYKINYDKQAFFLKKNLKDLGLKRGDEYPLVIKLKTNSDVLFVAKNFIENYFFFDSFMDNQTKQKILQVVFFFIKLNFRVHYFVVRDYVENEDFVEFIGYPITSKNYEYKLSGYKQVNKELLEIKDYVNVKGFEGYLENKLMNQYKSTIFIKMAIYKEDFFVLTEDLKKKKEFLPKNVQKIMETKNDKLIKNISKEFGSQLFGVFDLEEDNDHGFWEK